MTKKIGILLTNTGTPDAPTKNAVKQYLREFLSDKRIVPLPRIIWFPILYGLILIIRPRQSAKLYQKIWTEKGSPMRVLMQTLRNKLSTKISVPVAIGMHYGTPTIQQGLDHLQQSHVDEMIVLPLFPQYSHSTTASTFDRVTANVKKWPALPKLSYKSSYADHPRYIQALAASVRHFWNEHGASPHLLISFHGMPESAIKNGDPYQSQCELTSRLLANALNLSNKKWALCYQSQFGYAKWLQPATFNLLKALPKQGITHADVICPGFAVDCLETLEEISIRGKRVFNKAGGQLLRYIPALNDSDWQTDLLAAIVQDR